MWFALVLESPVRFVGGLDAPRFQKMRDFAVLGIRVATFGFCVGTLGYGLALVGTAEDAQRVGAVLSLCGHALACGSVSTAMLYVAFLLGRILNGLDKSSSSAKQVLNVRNALCALGILCSSNGPVCVVLVAVPATRALAGILTLFIAAMSLAILSIGIPLYEFRRLAPARARRARKVHALKPSAAPAGCGKG